MGVTWPKVRLGEVVTAAHRGEAPMPGKIYRQLGVKLWGEGAYERESMDGIATKYSQLFRAEAGDIIVNKIWARNGSVAVVPESLDGCYGSGEFPMFTPLPNRLDCRWMHWLTKTPDFWVQCDEKSQGTSGKNRIKPEQFLALEIPLPPLSEQRRIVGRIEELSAEIDAARQLRAEAAEEADSIFSSGLALCLEPIGDGWKRENIGNVILSMDAGWSPQCDEVPAQNDQWGVLKTTAVQWCEFRPHENKALPLSLEPQANLCVRDGDVLVTRAGPRKRVGVVAAVRESSQRLTISDKLIRLRPDPRKVDALYLQFALSSPYSQDHLVARKTGLADAQVNISQAILRSTPIAYPSIAEQGRIVGTLDGLKAEVDALKTGQAKTSAEIDALLPSILDRAFKGELI